MTWNRRELMKAALATPFTPLKAASAAEEPSRRSAGFDDRLGWFLDARFGLFVHWGPYSLAGVEASWPIMVPELALLIGPEQRITEADYVALAQRFAPSEFSPREWVRLAREAGMRYLVVTAKHHDGFCLFDAPGTDYKITTGPYGRDLLSELADVCAAQKMPLGFYYSPPDMHHPGYRDTSRPATENWQGEPDRAQWSDYLDTMEAHLRTLLTDYGEIAVLWFDGLFDHDKYDPERFHSLVRELSPATLVNDRLGAQLGDYVTPEQAVPAGVPVRRDAPPPEVSPAAFRQFVELLTSGMPREQSDALFAAAQRSRFPTEPYPPPDRFQPWEACMTLGRSWAYDPLERDLKSTATVIRTLVEVASRGGNLLLNVGPTPEGTIPESAQQRLRGVGRWLERYGESIYETTYGPVQPGNGGPPEVRSTQSPQSVYLQLLEWPAEELRVTGLPDDTRSARLLADGITIEQHREQTGTRLSLPDEPPAGDAAGVTVIALERATEEIGR